MSSRRRFLRTIGAFGLSLAGAGAPAGAAPVTATSADRRIVYLASYSHIDADWLWPFQEGEQQASATFRSVLAVLDAFPKLKFSMTASSHYKWVRESDPALFDRVRAAVDRGQWEPIGGWWVEADTNIPSGEALMRQALFGQREIKDHLNVTSQIAFLPDSFGSSANLPAILRASGFEGYVMKRGDLDDGSTPPPEMFSWQGLGESSIATYKLPLWNGSNDIVAKVGQLASYTLHAPPLVLFGLGDHGGGPSRAAMEQLATYAGAPDAPDLRLVRVADYFALDKTPALAVRGELEGDLVGSYGNAAALKRALHRSERELIDAERYDVLTHLLGIPSEPPDLDAHWQMVLQRQHHDTVSGTATQASMRRATEEVRAVATTVRETTDSILEKIVARIAHTESSDYVLAVFNPLDHAVRVPVVYAVGAGSFSSDPDQTLAFTPNVCVDARGNAIPLQIANADDGLFSGSIFPIVFNVGVPAFGYTTARLRTIRGADLERRTPDQGLELRNDRIVATFDPQSGQPSGIATHDGTQLLHAPSRLFVYNDTADTWGRWQMPVAAKDVHGALQLERWRTMEDGLVRGVLRVWLKYRDSTIRQDWVLYPGETTLHSFLTIDWHEKQTRLGFGMTPSLPFENARYDVPFGRVTRKLADLLKPASSSVTVGTKTTLSILGAGEKAFWAGRGSIGMNLLRTVPYAYLSERAAAFTPDQLQDYGEHETAFAVHVGDGDERAIARVAEAVDRQFPVVWVGVHGGSEGAERGFASIDPEITLASARRDRREAGRVVVRVHDESGVAHDSGLTLGPLKWSGAIDAFGIKTVAFDAGGEAKEIVDS